jgi:hypothetical protein
MCHRCRSNSWFDRYMTLGGMTLVTCLVLPFAIVAIVAVAPFWLVGKALELAGISLLD